MRSSNNNFRNSYSLDKLLVLFMFAFFLAVFSGCQNDDDDDDDDKIKLNNSLLNGTHYTGIFAQSGTTKWNQTGDMVFDGSGDYDYSILYDSTDETGDYPGTYTVTENGDFAMPGTDVIGIASSDGKTVLFTDTAPAGLDDAIYLGVSIEKPSGMAASDLSGDYVIGQIRHDGTRTKTAYFVFNFDGAGTLSGSCLADTDDSTGDLSGTYDVSSDGALDITITGLLKDFQGYISEGGDVLMVLDTDDDGEVLLMVGLKKTTGADASLFNGNYQMNQFGGDDNSQWSTRISAAADGTGNVSATLLSDSEGDSGTYNMSYSIGSDGTIELTDVGKGIISSDGNIVLLVDTEATDDNVMLMLGIKKQ